MPNHHILTEEELPPRVLRDLQDSLVLVHGGMAQNVGPILEMVTEKYLLRCETEWAARKQAMAILDEVLGSLRKQDVRAIGSATTRNFLSPIQSIIPWASNYYTESLIASVGGHFSDDFWGFWMLGGMSGGGMGFIFDPRRKRDAQDYLQATMSDTRRRLQHALPFAMEPVVYDFAINTNGTTAQLLAEDHAVLPPGYYAIMVPQWLRADPRTLTPMVRVEMDRFGQACRENVELSGMIEVLFDRLLPRQRERPQGAFAGDLAGAAWLRPGAARAHSRRPEQWTHRPGAEPLPGRHRD